MKTLSFESFSLYNKSLPVFKCDFKLCLIMIVSLLVKQYNTQSEFCRHAVAL